MIDEDVLRAQLPHALRETRLPIGPLRRGKVRDVYELGDRLLLVATDRLSAFDVVLTTVPFKGQLLTELAAWWFEQTRDVCPNHVLSHPDPAALLVRRCHALPVEVVVRGYITGSLWRDHVAGTAGVYGIDLPRGLRKDQVLDAPLITPSTKAEVGAHDEPLSPADVVRRGLVPAPVWARCEELARALFRRGQELARRQGLILVDTKYEFGLAGDELLVIDEIHTPDSSRYWEASEYAARFADGAEQLMLDKENIRQWLIKERGFQGKGAAPAIPDGVRIDLAQKYVAAFERITGRRFEASVGDPASRLARNLRAAGVLA